MSTESTLEQLKQAQPDELLAAFVERFNDMTAAMDDQDTEAALLRQQLEGYKRQVKVHQEELADLQANYEAVKAENAECRQMALEAEKIANKTSATVAELKRARATISEQRQQMQAYTGGNDPKKLKAKVADLKEKNATLQKRNTRLTNEARDLRKERDMSRQRFNDSCGVIQELKQELSKGLETGLWHQGDHHLVIWSQKVQMQREDGTTFLSQPLLYLHQSGRGGMMHWDPESGMAHLCASPKGGLRPSEAALQAAGDWLYKVNVLQDGEVREEDRRPVNYNGEAAA